jgi:hypothetical protein
VGKVQVAMMMTVTKVVVMSMSTAVMKMNQIDRER